MNSTAEQELRDLVAARVSGVITRDVDALSQYPADDVITFDVLPPLNSRGSNTVREHLQEWFDGYATVIGYEVVDLNVWAADDLGFCSFLYHVSGSLVSGDEVDMWVRATLGCIRTADGWRIVHDHESVPFDPTTGKAEISLRPS